jgi:hypothetical protein
MNKYRQHPDWHTERIKYRKKEAIGFMTILARLSDIILVRVKLAANC